MAPNLNTSNLKKTPCIPTGQWLVIFKPIVCLDATKNFKLSDHPVFGNWFVKKCFTFIVFLQFWYWAQDTILLKFLYLNEISVGIPKIRCKRAFRWALKIQLYCRTKLRKPYSKIRRMMNTFTHLSNLLPFARNNPNIKVITRIMVLNT